MVSGAIWTEITVDASADPVATIAINTAQIEPKAPIVNAASGHGGRRLNWFSETCESYTLLRQTWSIPELSVWPFPERKYIQGTRVCGKLLA